MSSSSYKNLKEILSSLNQSIDALESGKLNVDQLAEILEDAREFHERIAILQYLSNQPKQEKVIQEPVAPVVEVEKPAVAPIKPVNFKFAFDDEPIIANNQTNLLDAIQEEEVPEVTPAPVVKKEITPTASSVNEVNQEQESLNDKFAENVEKTSLADRLSKKPISDLVKAIGLNQKFLFMNDLFEGENNYYKEAITNLNTFASFIEADEYINTLKMRHNWDASSSTLKEFIELVERRYS